MSRQLSDVDKAALSQQVAQFVDASVGRKQRQKLEKEVQQLSNELRSIRRAVSSSQEATSSQFAQMTSHFEEFKTAKEDITETCRELSQDMIRTTRTVSDLSEKQSFLELNVTTQLSNISRELEALKEKHRFFRELLHTIETKVTTLATIYTDERTSHRQTKATEITLLGEKTDFLQEQLVEISERQVILQRETGRLYRQVAGHLSGQTENAESSCKSLILHPSRLESNDC